MNILYIIGNGLDIQYGLKTKYTDFYDYQLKNYKTDKENNANYNVIYEYILMDNSKNYENWSDLELALGNLTKNENIDEDELMEALDELIVDLSNYLRIEENKFKTGNNTIDIQNELNNFLGGMADEFRNKIFTYLNSKGWEYDNIEILTFNYTGVLDKLIDKVKSTQYKFPRECSHGCFINGVVHAHGTLDSYLILGVNDETQLNNDYSIENINFLKKESIQEALRENTLKKTYDMINNADIIIIFGMSIGDTDKYIWEKIAKSSIEKNIPIIIYTYVKDFDLIKKKPRKLANNYSYIINNFAEKSSINDELLLESLKSNIVPVLSKRIFDIK